VLCVASAQRDGVDAVPHITELSGTQKGAVESGGAKQCVGTVVNKPPPVSIAGGQVVSHS
jgi:hypothetical protein